MKSDNIQVISKIEDKTIRVFNIVDFHIGDKDDPLTTVVIQPDVYQDIKL